MAGARENKGAAGCDEVSVPDLSAPGTRALAEDQSRTGGRNVFTQRGTPSIDPKANGDKRPLGIPCVADRVIQQAIAQVIGPIFESQFSHYSYGFRPGRNAHQAVRRVREYFRQGYKQLVDIDLAAFFDSVNHDVLMRLLAPHIRDKRVLKLIRRYLRAGVMVDGMKQPTPLGVPGVTSLRGGLAELFCVVAILPTDPRAR